LSKQLGMLELMMKFHDLSRDALTNHISLESILDLPLREQLSRLRDIPDDSFDTTQGELSQQLDDVFMRLLGKGPKS